MRYGDFIDHDFDIIENSHCSPKHDTFGTLYDAEKSCTDDPSCAMIYDEGRRHTTFHLCDEGAETVPSTDESILYIKGNGMRNHSLL